MKAAVIGAGRMGRAAVYDLARNADVEAIGVFDIDGQSAEQVAGQFGDGKAVWRELDAGNTELVTEVLGKFDAAISCVTYSLNPGLTRAAIAAKCHFVDLGGNNDVVRSQLGLDESARAAGITVVPDCGLAPGMVSVLAVDGMAKFDRVTSLRIRVGGLPQSPRPPLNYQMVFSAEGLINEYWEPCLILEDGVKKTVSPMTAVESLTFDGIGEFEAFYTSGGTSTLTDSFQGKVGFLDYKTIRYPGHCQCFRPILELGLASRKAVNIDGHEVRPRDVLKRVLEQNLTFSDPDMVLVRLTFTGTKDKQEQRLIYEIIDRQDSRTGLTAMMRTTAFPATIMVWMAAAGMLSDVGCRPQELVVPPAVFISELKKRGINVVIREAEDG